MNPEQPPRPETAAAPFNTLTKREHEVLSHLVAGRTYTEIAEALFISMATVKTHVRHIFAKLDLRDRAQAVVLAYETGLVQPGELEP